MRGLSLSGPAPVIDLFEKRRRSGTPRSGKGSSRIKEPPRPAPLTNSRLALFAFLGAEIMFFAGLIGAFVVLRLGSVTWPPAQQPRLPIEITALNTLVLIASGVVMHRAVRELHRGKEGDFHRAFLLAAILGILFLAVQGWEWIRLVHFGLTVSAGIYGSTFYTIVGFHGAHVLGAVIWLAVILAKIRRREPSRPRTEWVELCAIYWYFVVGLWPIIYGLVYLS